MLNITEQTSKAELLSIWHSMTNELVDAFIAANVDPDAPETTADEIRNVITAWIEAGDECAGA